MYVQEVRLRRMRRKLEPLQIKECLLHEVHLRAFRLIRNQRLEYEAEYVGLLLCLTFARIRLCETLRDCR
ncbi:hypothetical protein LSAT2_019401 [Lamellibrachia satsuma]|nr:hypothetical protein LSAT2_019401 [Lamellibrachia satsuma]